MKCLVKLLQRLSRDEVIIALWIAYQAAKVDDQPTTSGLKFAPTTH